jgi:predicted dehydrogenase
MVRTILNVGIIGTGEWTERMHLPVFRSCKRARVVAICGHDHRRNRQIAARFDVPTTYTDYHDLLERVDIDIIVVSTSTNRHFEPALASVRAGKAVLCEKPLTDDYLKARKLSEEAKARGVRTKIAFVFRYSPILQRMKGLILDGFIGRPFHFNGFIQNSRYAGTGTSFPLTPTSDLLIPGSLQEYSPHLIDLARWLNGDLVKVASLMKNFVPMRRVREHGKVCPVNFEDGSVWIAEFQNGAIATFQSSFVAIGPRPGLEIRILGSRGSLIAQIPDSLASEAEGTLLSARIGSSRFVPVKVSQSFRFTKHDRGSSFGLFRFTRLVESFLDEIADNREPADDFEAGVKTQEIMTAVYQSYLEGQWVVLPLT